MNRAKKGSSAGGASISPELFDRFRQFIRAELGIKMPDTKRTMLQTRLQKRMRRLNIPSFEEYYTYVFESEIQSDEIYHLLDVVTTNKTDFFREPKHFDILTSRVLPELYPQVAPHRALMAWSAGCSTGAEPYTLAMVLDDASRQYPDFRFGILATDISTRVLNIAKHAIYDAREAQPIPPGYKKKYLMRSIDRDSPRIRIVPELRHHVTFRRLNFMDNEFDIKPAMDIVFCRNVIIYFDRPTQEQVVQRICRHLRPGGYLFMGHSETLNGLKLPLRQVMATVYQKVGEKSA